MLSLFQHGLAWLLLAILVSGDGVSSKLFTKGPAFALHREATFTVTCPELGRSGSFMTINYTKDGPGRFPALDWKSPSPGVKEYMIIVENPDTPDPHPILHGLYYGIPRVFTGLADEDFRHNGSAFAVTGGFKYGENGGGGIYLPPRPTQGHGLHRYFFQVMALNQPIDQRQLSLPATVKEVSHTVEGKVIGWGSWIGLV